MPNCPGSSQTRGLRVLSDRGTTCILLAVIRQSDVTSLSYYILLFRQLVLTGTRVRSCLLCAELGTGRLRIQAVALQGCSDEAP